MRTNRWLTLLALAAAWTAGLPAGRAAFYRAGDLVEDFSLIDRTTRQPVRLSDLAGKIVFLEWFAWWCPFCQAAAPQVGEGIVEWYAARGGNPSGIPVLHVAINLQPSQETQTQNFVDRAGFHFVLEDFQRTLANRFQTGGQPIFAIINAVTNSPSHRPWELLLHQDGYGQRDFRESIVRFRAAIDAVQAAPPAEAPRITRQPAGGTWKEGQPLELSVAAEGTAPLAYAWHRDGLRIEGVDGPVLAFAAARPADAGSYTVRISNSAGSITSEPAEVRVEGLPPAPPRLAGLRRGTDGDLVIEIQGIGRAGVVLEISRDLQRWETFRDFPGENPPSEIIISVMEEGAAFFRLRAP